MYRLRHLLLLGLFQLVAIPLIGCQCYPYVPDFFWNILNTDLICLAVCEGTGQDFEYDGLQAETGFFRILDPMTISTQEQGDTILVTGQDGLNCGEMLSRFNVGDTLFLALGSGFYYEFARDTFYLEGACGQYYLEVEEGKNQGLTIPQIKEKIRYLTAFDEDHSWQMFHPYRELLFGNVKALWVDSLTVGEQTQYYFNHNIQMAEDEWCHTPYGPSWAGQKVSIGPDREHTFFNKNGDSILVLCQAMPGESWLCYEREGFYVEGFVADLDTMSFLGVSDSVKTLGFRVFDQDGSEMDHDLNQMTLLLSKEYGVIRILNFKLFPDMEELAYGYYEDEVQVLNLVGMTNPALGLQNFGWQQIFGFAVGDEFHVLDSWWRSINSWSEDESFRETKTILKVIEAAYSELEFSYSFERRELIYTEEGEEKHYEYIHDTITRIHEPDPVLDLMPGESHIDNGWAYSVFMAGGDPPSKTVPTTAAISGTPADSCWGPIMFDGCFKDNTYFVGLGGPYGSCTGGLDGWSEASTELVYYSKSWGTWGTPLIFTGMRENKNPVRVRIFPNPARDHLIIKSGGKITEVQIIDISGRILLRDKSHGQERYIDLVGFQSGIYLVGIEMEGVYHWEKVILQ